MQPTDDARADAGSRPPARVEPRADARAIAWQALRAVEDGRADRLGDLIAANGATDEDLGLARELAFGVARHHRLYDFLADPFLRPGDQPPDLRRVLRLGAHQLFALDRVPPHAAVHATIETLKQCGSPRLAGVANAVLRRLSEMRLAERSGDGPEGRLPPEALPDDPAVRHSLPPLLVADALASDPPGGAAALAALNRLPHLCTRTRPGRPRPNGTGILRQDGAWTWWSDPRAALAGPVASGDAVVQDRAQGELVDLAAPRPGDLILDCCAAPGGKALAFIDRGCRVVAADLSPVRLRAMTLPAPTMAMDGCRPAVVPAFDLVVVDAPCSNSGVLARRPEARWRYDREHLADLGRLQRDLLGAAATRVIPGGRLIYATCSIAQRENQAVAHGLHGWRILAERCSWPDEWRAGGYAAVLVRA